MYEYYYYDDCYCVVGTTHSFETKEDMETYMGENGIEINVPDYAHAFPDLMKW